MNIVNTQVHSHVLRGIRYKTYKNFNPFVGLMLYILGIVPIPILNTISEIKNQTHKPRKILLDQG